MEAALVGASGRTTLGTTTLTIGRRADNALVIQDAKASSRHAEIRPMGEGFQIVDLGSTNGTFVNEQRLAPNIPQLLHPGDIIRIGDTRFTYEAQTYAATVLESQPNYPPNPANPAYLPTVAASAPPDIPGVAANPVPEPFPNYNPAPAVPSYEQNPAYNPTVAAPSPYTAYQGGQVPPPPAYDAPSPYQQPPQYVPPYGQPAMPYGQAAAPYGQPPAPSARPPAASLTTRFKTDGRFRLYVIGAGAALLVIIIAIVAVAAGASSPSKTLTQYCNDWKASDFNSAYDLLSSGVQAQVSREAYINAEQSGVNQLGGVTNCSVTGVAENDPSANGEIVYTFGDGRTATGRYTLVQQSGTWKISNENFNP